MAERQTHSFKKSKLYSWPKCVHCGLLKLNNPGTEVAVRLGCDWQEILQQKKEK